jgi:hypothetical protein
MHVNAQLLFFFQKKKSKMGRPSGSIVAAKGRIEKISRSQCFYGTLRLKN